MLKFVLLVAVLFVLVLVAVGVVIRRHLRWLDHVTPVPTEVYASIRQRCVRLSLSVEERKIRLGARSGPPRCCVGNEKFRVLYWRTDHRTARVAGPLVETISVSEAGRDGSLRVTFRDNGVVEWSESGTPGRPRVETTTMALVGILRSVRLSVGVWLFSPRSLRAERGLRRSRSCRFLAPFCF